MPELSPPPPTVRLREHLSSMPWISFTESRQCSAHVFHVVVARTNEPLFDITQTVRDGTVSSTVRVPHPRRGPSDHHFTHADRDARPLTKPDRQAISAMGDLIRRLTSACKEEPVPDTDTLSRHLRDLITSSADPDEAAEAIANIIGETADVATTEAIADAIELRAAIGATPR